MRYSIEAKQRNFLMKIEYLYCMEKVLRITPLHEQKNDFEFWKTKTPEERFAALEFLREQYFKMSPDIPLQLQRICRIVERKRG